MTTRFKDFGKGSGVSHEPLKFKLHDEEFECYPALQGKVLLEMVARSTSNDTSDMADSVMGFFEKTLKPESYERFQALTQDPNRVVTVETLGEITSWLVGEYSDRPTQQPEDSSNGQ